MSSVVTNTRPASGHTPSSYSTRAAPNSVVSTSVPLTESPTIGNALATANRTIAASVNASARSSAGGRASYTASHRSAGSARLHRRSACLALQQVAFVAGNQAGGIHGAAPPVCEAAAAGFAMAVVPS